MRTHGLVCLLALLTATIAVADPTCEDDRASWIPCVRDSDCLVGFSVCHSLAAYNRMFMGAFMRHTDCEQPRVKCSAGASDEDLAKARAVCTENKCTVVLPKGDQSECGSSPECRLPVMTPCQCRKLREVQNKCIPIALHCRCVLEHLATVCSDENEKPDASRPEIILHKPSPDSLLLHEQEKRR